MPSQLKKKVKLLKRFKIMIDKSLNKDDDVPKYFRHYFNPERDAQLVFVKKFVKVKGEKGNVVIFKLSNGTI